jgi:hypothetical protein
MDCHNQYRNNQHLNKYRNIKEGTKLSHLTMSSQKLTPNSGSHPRLRFPACSLRRGDIEFEKTIVWRQQSKETRKKRCGRCAYFYDKTI